MFSTKHSLSARQFEPRDREPLATVTSDDVSIAAQMVRPAAQGRFPVLLSVHAYDTDAQFGDMKPVSYWIKHASLEAGPTEFYVRRGYIHIIANVRGTGQSGGEYGNLDPRGIRDVYELIEWLARQPFCDGNVGMTGISYFSLVQQYVAALHPPHLKAIWAPYGWNDMYRDRYYRGGILAEAFMSRWVQNFIHRGDRSRSMTREKLGEKAWRAAIERARADPEIAAKPNLVEALEHADESGYSLTADILINPLDGEYYRERSVDFARPITVPAYHGGCWSMYGLHLPGAIRAYENWAGPKRLTIGPPVYLDRPFYQYQLEQLRWFDYWLKGNDTGMLEEPPIQLFIDGSGEWKQAQEWPLPETWWIPFYLHQDALLSEHEFWPDDKHSSFDDAPGAGGALTFRTPPMVEATEICGPIALNLYGSTTDNEVLWYVSLLEIDPRGEERLLTRGWLRGSQRRLDPERSKPWQPVHLHQQREALRPGEIYEFNIEIRPYGILLRPGYRLAVRIRCRDDEWPVNMPQLTGQGGIARPNRSTVTVHHDRAHPSHLLLPVTRGNRAGTFYSGGKLLAPLGPRPGTQAR